MKNFAEKSKEAVKKSFEKGKESIKSANAKKKKMKNDTDLEEGDCKLLGSGDGIELDQDMNEMTELTTFSKVTNTDEDIRGSTSRYSKLSGNAKDKSKLLSYEEEMKEQFEHLNKDLTRS